MDNIDDVIVIEDNTENMLQNDNCDVEMYMDQIDCETADEEYSLDESGREESVESIMDTFDVEELDFGEDDVGEGELIGSECEAALADSVESRMSSDVDMTEEVPDDADSSLLMRQILEQNVSTQKLPSDSRVIWEDLNDKGNCDCELKNDIEVKVKYKSNGDTVTYTGKEFKEHMKEKYGLDYVEYKNKEPDFSPYEKLISKQEMEEFLYDKYGESREVNSDVEGHVYVDKMRTERNGSQGSYSDAEKEIADRLGVDTGDIRDFMKENDLTWHECGDLHTIRIVPTEINQVFGHTGGIGIQKDTEAFIQGIENLAGTSIQNLSLSREGYTGVIEEAEGLPQGIREHYQEIKRKKFH